jgi:hypothetical protein
MTDHDLATLVADHVSRTEPPFALDSGHAILLGRRTLRRRRARRGAAGLIGIAAAALVVPMLISNAPAGDRGGREDIDPATAAALEIYDAAAMPGILGQRVRAAIPTSVADFGPETFTAADSEGHVLPPKYFDKASNMTVAYGGASDRQLQVSLTHSRSEAEGGARRNCARDLESGSFLRCTVTTAVNGDVVTTRVMAVRRVEQLSRGWSVVTRDELRTGVARADSPTKDPIDPSTLYFKRTVESVHSASYLTSAEETVRATDLDTALERFRAPVAALTTIVTDPALVIPEPPLGKGGCPWTLPGNNVTCARNPG